MRIVRLAKSATPDNVKHEAIAAPSDPGDGRKNHDEIAQQAQPDDDAAELPAAPPHGSPRTRPALFDPLAERFERFADIHDPVYRHWLLRAIPDRSEDRHSCAVDLGCGSGRFTPLLADRFADVLAVDISERV